MKTSTRLALAAGGLFTLAGIVAIGYVDLSMRRHALEEARIKADILLDRSLAIHTYFTHQLKPVLFKATEAATAPGYFEPRWMSSTFAVREINKYFEAISAAGYYYKECAANARSPENEADEYERAFLAEMNRDPGLAERSAIRVIDGRPFFTVLKRGEAMEEACLRCHSRPEVAPADLVRIYGAERSFDRRTDEVVSAVSVRIPLAEAYAESNEVTLRLALLFGGILMALFGGLSWLHNRWLLGPLNAIRNKARQISTDPARLGERIDLPPGRELADLTRAFNALSGALRRERDAIESKVADRTKDLAEANRLLADEIDKHHLALEELAQARKRMDSLMANLRGMAYRCLNDRDWTMKFVSAGCLELTGIAPEELVENRRLSYRGLIHPEDRQAVWDRVQLSLSRGEPFDLTYRIVCADGANKWVSEKGQAVSISAGGMVILEGFISDVSLLKQAEEAIGRLNEELEKRVRKRTTQLEAANSELEAFSYSVSHDLRAPLRAIDGFARIVMEEYAPWLDAEGQRLLGIIRQNTLKMAALIEDLLAFSRVGRHSMTLSRVDMGGLVAAVLEEQRPSGEDGACRIEVGGLPACTGDSALLRQVWGNLIANAFKFTVGKNPAAIEIGGRSENGEQTYWVRDNGAGFDMRYAHKLFGVFQRLHSDSEFDGTGVGLAIVKRIVGRHGGRVWAEGAVDRGATFSFSISTKGAMP